MTPLLLRLASNAPLTRLAAIGITAGRAHELVIALDQEITT